MRVLLTLLTLLTTTANAEGSLGWELYLIDSRGGRHLQIYTDAKYAGEPIHYVSEDGCVSNGVEIVTSGLSKYVGFYCKEVKR